MHLRSYQAADLNGCLAIFDSNTPKFFARHERAEFAEFLQTKSDPYFVVVDDQGQMIGCGGYYVNHERSSAGLTWGMVSQSRHRQGIGRFLLLARLQYICQEPGVERVFINTSQYSAGFFEKVGFVLDSVVENGFAEGLHVYKMTLFLTQEVRQRLSPRQMTRSTTHSTSSDQPAPSYPISAA